MHAGGHADDQDLNFTDLFCMHAFFRAGERGNWGIFP